MVFVSYWSAEVPSVWEQFTYPQVQFYGEARKTCVILNFLHIMKESKLLIQLANITNSFHIRNSLLFSNAYNS